MVMRKGGYRTEVMRNVWKKPEPSGLEVKQSEVMWKRSLEDGGNEKCKSKFRGLRGQAELKWVRGQILWEEKLLSSWL